MAGKRKFYGSGVGGSIRDLADKVGRDEKAVRLWMKRDDWPFSTGGPWAVKVIKLWMQTHLESDPWAEYRGTPSQPRNGSDCINSTTALAGARIENVTERTLLIRQRRVAEKRRLISADEARRIRLRQTKAVRDALLPLPKSISHVLAGKSRDQIEEVLTETVAKIIRAFANGYCKN